MPGDRVHRWLGCGLIALSATATLWLAGVGKLSYYIHPRYTTFTVVLAGVGLLLVLLAVGLAPREGSDAPEHEGHGHEEHGPHPVPRGRRVLSVLRVGLLVVVAVGLLVVPPATLTARTRLSRDLATSSQGTDPGSPVLRGGDPSGYSVKDWAALLRQGGPEAVLGRRVDLSGYLVDGKDADVFSLVRLTVTCCAIDAEPVGVPVYRPGWRQDFRAGDWVAVQGAFDRNPDPDSAIPTVIRAVRCTGIDEPDQPYVF